MQCNQVVFYYPVNYKKTYVLFSNDIMERKESMDLKIGKDRTMTVPNEVIDYLHLYAGDIISFDALDDNTVVISKYQEV